MALIRWQPFHEMDYLQRDMNRLFDRLTSTATNGNDLSRSAFVPPAELKEDDEAVHLKLEVPGMTAEDLDIQVSAEIRALPALNSVMVNSNALFPSPPAFKIRMSKRIIRTVF
jgi:HSP20 family protein